MTFARKRVSRSIVSCLLTTFLLTTILFPSRSCEAAEKLLLTRLVDEITLLGDRDELDWRPEELLGAAELVVARIGTVESRQDVNLVFLRNQMLTANSFARRAVLVIKRAGGAIGETEEEILLRALILCAVTTDDQIAAMNHLSEAATIAPHNGYIAMLKGVRQWEAGQLSKSRESIQEALTSETVDAYCRNYLQMCLSAMRRLGHKDPQAMRHLLSEASFLFHNDLRVKQADLSIALQERSTAFKVTYGGLVPRYFAVLAINDPIGFQQYSSAITLKMLQRQDQGESKRAIAKRHFEIAKRQVIADNEMVRGEDVDSLSVRITTPELWWAEYSQRLVGVDVSAFQAEWYEEWSMNGTKAE